MQFSFNVPNNGRGRQITFGYRTPDAEDGSKRLWIRETEKKNEWKETTRFVPVQDSEVIMDELARVAADAIGGDLDAAAIRFGRVFVAMASRSSGEYRVSAEMIEDAKMKLSVNGMDLITLGLE